MKQYKQYGYRFVGRNADYALLVMRCVFAAFLMIYFYKGAAPVLALEQNRLSEGTTSFSPVVGAVVLTALLVWLQSVIAKYLRFSANAKMLTFVPSSVIAVLLTAFYPKLDVTALSVSLLLLICWAVVAVKEQAREQRPRPRLNLMSALWQMLAMFLFIGLFGNTNSVLNYEARSAHLVSQGDYEDAIGVGGKSLETSSRLTAIRAFALSHIPGGMGNKMFSFPIPEGGSRNLSIPAADSLAVLMPTDSLLTFVRQASDRRLALRSKPVADYRLCAFLLDRNLADFAAELPIYYKMDNLPKYYAQAMVLYARQNPRQTGGYVNESELANYLDFKEEGDKYSREDEKKGALMKDYGDTYWWYYFFGSKHAPAEIKKPSSFCQLP